MDGNATPYVPFSTPTTTRNHPRRFHTHLWIGCVPLATSHQTRQGEPARPRQQLPFRARAMSKIQNLSIHGSRPDKRTRPIIQRAKHRHGFHSRGYGYATVTACAALCALADRRRAHAVAFPRALERECGTGHSDTSVPGWCSVVFHTPRRVRRSREGSPWQQRGAGSQKV